MAVMPKTTLDAKGLACPLPVVKARLEIDKLGAGEVLEVLAEFDQAISVARAVVPDLNARIEVIDTAEPSETPDGTTLVELVSQGRDAFGIEGYEVGYAGATDARFLINQGRIPSLVFGPGDPLLAHTTGEYVRIDQLVDATRVYAYAFAKFLTA